MSFAFWQHVKPKASRSLIVPATFKTGSPKSGSEVNKVREEFNTQILVCSKGRADFISGKLIYSIRRTNVLMKTFRSFYIKYLFLLILSVVSFASGPGHKTSAGCKTLNR